MGGNGLRTVIAGPDYPIGYPGPGSSTNGWFAGGGHGSGAPGSLPGDAPMFGTSSSQGGAALASSGSGGNGNSGGGAGGAGGSGIVVVRYQIAAACRNRKSIWWCH